MYAPNVEWRKGLDLLVLSHRQFPTVLNVEVN